MDVCVTIILLGLYLKFHFMNSRILLLIFSLFILSGCVGGEGVPLFNEGVEEEAMEVIEEIEIDEAGKDPFTAEETVAEESDEGEVEVSELLEESEDLEASEEAGELEDSSSFVKADPAELEEFVELVDEVETDSTEELN